MENQGFSLGTLSRETNIKRWKLYEIFNGRKAYLDFKERMLLKQLCKNGSFIIKESRNKLVEIINGKPYLDVSQVLPQESRSGFPLYIKNMGEDTIKVWYQPKTRGKTEFLLPKKIKLDKTFFIGLGLSIGDGLNNPNKRNIHYNFSNTNLDLIKLAYKWLIDYLKINKKFIEIYFIFPKGFRNRKNILIKFEKVLNISKNCIKCYSKERHRQPIAILQISNAIFQHFYLNLFNKLNNKILNNKEFRISFLSGLFAAEGHIKHSVYGTIESIQFSFDPKREISLAKFIRRCLLKEGIKSKIDPKKSLYFCGYEKMLKFYIRGLVDIHVKKKNKFLGLCSNAEIIVHLKRDLINKLKTLSQSSLSKLLGCSQPLISLYIKKERVNMSYLNNLLPFFEIKKNDLIKYVKYLRVTNSKIKDKESIKFLMGLNGF